MVLGQGITRLKSGGSGIVLGDETMFHIRGANPPTIALILAAAFMWWGFTNNSLISITVGGVFAAIGIGLQVLYLRYRYGRAAYRRTKVEP
ncbi:MAG: hypothetical protein DMF76_00565 [Acidobacteria bacterium]|nr:MAG: hypothetical protein DMF76_00565 [Acidobacteriota bacterium]